MMAAAYFYNLTFLHLGLHALCTRVIGMSERAVAANMARFALMTCLVGFVFGLLMSRLGWSHHFFLKQRLSFTIVLVQTLLTAIAPRLRSEELFSRWTVSSALTLGVGMLVMFGMVVHLIPVRDRE